MLGKTKAFTLVELLIAVFISTLVVLGLVGTYKSVQDVRKRFEEYEQNRKLYELIYLIQKQLLNCKNFELKDDTISYHTTFGISAPYVMVSLYVQRGVVMYSESNPYKPSITYLNKRLRILKDLKIETDKGKNMVSLSYGNQRVHLLVQYNKVPTSSIFLRPF